MYGFNVKKLPPPPMQAGQSLKIKPVDVALTMIEMTWFTGNVIVLSFHIYSNKLDFIPKSWDI